MIFSVSGGGLWSAQRKCFAIGLRVYTSFRMSRILFTRFPLESAHGGAENQTTWLAAGLQSRGHAVSFLGSCPALLAMFPAAGLSVTTLEIGPPPVTKFGAFSFLWRKSAMTHEFKKAFESMPQPPDVVFMLSLSEKILLTEWLSSRGVKVFWIEHDRVGRWLSGNPWLASLKTAAKSATIVCVSGLSRQKYLGLGFDPSRIVAIPNGVPIPENCPSQRASDGTLSVGCVARLSLEKGIDVLIAAAEHLPEVTLRIVGKGPQEGFLRSMMAEDAGRIGLPRIVLQSSVPDLGVFYESIDVLVLPSVDHDPFGLVAAEAMARGIPVIVTDQCGIAGSLADGVDALVVAAGSSAQLASALQRLRDPALRMKFGEAARVTAQARFGLGTMVDAYDTLLRSSLISRASAFPWR